MVHGLEKFKEYFAGYTNQYVFIGGTACDILMEDIGVPFRATKDLDIVLIVEALDVSFGETFWKFIEEGGYKYREKSTGESRFYRFSGPSRPEYPKMIEIETVILFKIKAWIDMKQKINMGETIDSKNVRKHKNDIFRLLPNITPSTKINVPQDIKKDIVQFIELIDEDKPDLKNLGLTGKDFNELIELLKNIYL